MSAKTMLTPEQEALQANARMLSLKPESWRGHKFYKQGNMLSGETISESWYGCACGAGLMCRVDMRGPKETHVYFWSEVLFDCPLPSPPAEAPAEEGNRQ